MARISFDGFKDIEKMLLNERERVERNAFSALKAGAEVAREEMKKRIPKGPHADHLRDSIGIDGKMKYSKLDGYSISVGPDGYRESDNEPFPKIGFSLEYGTDKMDPHPWMRPAIKSKQKEIQEAMIKELMK